MDLDIIFLCFIVSKFFVLGNLLQSILIISLSITHFLGNLLCQLSTTVFDMISFFALA